MGYKLAGFDVIGFNEIDPKMAKCYIENHNPKYSFIEPIQTFKSRKDLPKELYELDVLDGSPPCSNFSMNGNREKDWGKEKKFREGQSLQVLDTLFFDFIDLAKELQPKIVIAENVKGLLLGNAMQYVKRILIDFDKAGYYVKYFLLDASKMGVPQRRERVFFIALRKDLIQLIPNELNIFSNDYEYNLNLDFNEKEIKLNELLDDTDIKYRRQIIPAGRRYWDLIKEGESISKVHEKGSFFNFIKLSPNKCCPTLTSESYRMLGLENSYCLSEQELLKISTFPTDYEYQNKNRINGNGFLGFLVGMSVPPIMIAQIVSKIYEQWNLIFKNN